jgi:rSAM/selenodomain-associated transferase 1
MEQHLAEPEASLGPVLGIFAKEPVPGRVKTRLCPPLSAAEAAAVSQVCLAETVATMSRGPFVLVLFYAGREEYFRRSYPGLPLVPQAEGDLGRRMERALAALLQQGHGAAALIGSDSPDLPLARVEAAFAALGQADCVIVPAEDGGYVLVGERRHHPELFDNIPWSTARVLDATRRRATEIGIAYRELAPWADVDDLDSLKRLLHRSPGSATAAFALARLAHCL